MLKINFHVDFTFLYCYNGAKDEHTLCYIYQQIMGGGNLKRNEKQVELENKIEKLREELNINIIANIEKSEVPLSNKVISLSEELDILIAEYIKGKDIHIY